MANPRNERIKKMNSLEASWGNESSQQKWNRLREESISRITELLAKENNFDEIYKFIIAERVSIAIRNNSEPKFIKNVTRSRKDEISDHELSQWSSTIVRSGPVYGDFHHELSSIFNQYKDRYASFDNFNLEPWNRNDFVYRVGINLYNEYHTDSQAFSTITAVYNRVKYSTIVCMRSAEDWTDSAFVILHTRAEKIEFGMDTVKNLFGTLNQTKPESILLKINLIKEITWHLSHIMTQARGSAAINEMLLEAMLRHHCIEYKKTSIVPVDLIAIFSMKPEDFTQRFTINPEVENLQKEIQDFIIRCENNLNIPSMYFGYQRMIWRNFSATQMKTQISTAKKVIKLLNGDPCETFTTSEENILNKGDLANILNSAIPNLTKLLLDANMTPSVTNIPTFLIR